MNLNLIRNYLPSLDSVYYAYYLSYFELLALRRSVDFYKQIYDSKTSENFVDLPVGSHCSLRRLLYCLDYTVDFTLHQTFRFIFVINLVESLFDSNSVFLARYHNADYDSKIA